MTLIVFDLDGTLVDSHRDLADATNDVLAFYGAAPLPVSRVVRMVGDGARMLVERALGAAGVEAPIDAALEQFREAYDRRLLGHTRPYDGIPALVERLSGVATLSVLTNKPADPTRRLLRAFDLGDCFAAVVGGDTALPRKPDPAGLHHVMAVSGAGAGTTLFVGDSMIDRDTARRAGVRFCAALYGFGGLRGDLVLEDEDLRAADVAALGLAIDRWLGTQSIA